MLQNEWIVSAQERATQQHGNVYVPDGRRTDRMNVHERRSVINYAHAGIFRASTSTTAAGAMAAVRMASTLDVRL